MPLRASVPPSTCKGLEAALIGKCHLRTSTSLGDSTTFLAPVETNATYLLAQALRKAGALGGVRRARLPSATQDRPLAPAGGGLAYAAETGALIFGQLFDSTPVTKTMYMWLWDDLRYAKWTDRMNPWRM